MGARHSFLFILFVLVSFSAVASDNISDILNKMAAADEHLNYQGVFILRKSDNLMTMRVEHGTDRRGVWESLESLNGEFRKMIRTNEEVVSIYPQRKLLTVSHDSTKTSLHPTLPENLGKLKSYYKINRLRDDRIAGHNTAVLDVRPNDKYRYGYRYWLDAKTGVLLRCDLVNEKGHVIEQMMFTSLEYLKTVPDGAFVAVDDKGYERKLLDRQRVTTPKFNWKVSKLPSGFMLTQSSKRKQPRLESLHLIYSDGLASVSVFVEQGEKPNHHSGASSMGAVNVFGTRVGDHFVTVVGEVPATTVMQIAQSTRRTQ